MLYQLMNKDTVVATYEEQKRLDDYRYALVEQRDPYLPHGFAGTDFVAIVRALITPAIRTKLIALRDFAYEDPGLGYPRWKLDAVNRLKDRQISAILA